LHVTNRRIYEFGLGIQMKLFLAITFLLSLQEFSKIYLNPEGFLLVNFLKSQEYQFRLVFHLSGM